MMWRTSSTEPLRLKMPLSAKGLRALVDALAAGSLIVYPTETFYALGCVAWRREAVLSVLRLKERCEGEGLPLIGASIEVVRSHVHEPPLLQTMADAFWPGPLTVVMRLKAPDIQSTNLREMKSLPGIESPKLFDGQGPSARSAILEKRFGVVGAAARDGTIAVRVPGSSEARRLAGSGLLVATSANRRGAGAPASPEEIDPILLERVQILVDGGKTPGGLPSTILDLTGPRPRILRQGNVSRVAIDNVIKGARHHL